MEELHKAFYDHFDLKLSRLQVLVAGPGEDWRDGWSADSSPLHLLEPTGLELWLKRSLLPNDTRLPKLVVCVSVCVSVCLSVCLSILHLLPLLLPV